MLLGLNNVYKVHSVALRPWLSELCQQIHLAHHILFPSGASRKNVGFTVGKPLPPHPTVQKTWLSFETKEECKLGMLLKDSVVRPLLPPCHTQTPQFSGFSVHLTYERLCFLLHAMGERGCLAWEAGLVQGSPAETRWQECTTDKEGDGVGTSTAPSRGLFLDEAQPSLLPTDAGLCQHSVGCHFV